MDFLGANLLGAQSIFEPNFLHKPVSSIDEGKLDLHINNIPSTRYYGSKKRHLLFLYDNLKNIAFREVLDGFGGTASVSLLFKSMGKHVTYNDALYFNTICAKALLKNENTITQQEFKVFIDSVAPIQGFISKNFKDIYYLDDENEWLDGILSKIEKNERFKDVAFYCLVQACLKKRPFNLFHRANLYLRTNKLDVKRKFGNHVTWEKSFTEHMLSSYREYDKAIWDSKIKHTTLEPIDVSTINPGFDLVYLDPPYIGEKNAGENYLNKYHFLEGLANYENWFTNIDYSKKNKGFKPISYITDWQKRTTFKERLYELIAIHKNSIVVLSYMSASYPSKEDLVNYFNQIFKRVEIYEYTLNYALSKQIKKEILIIGFP